FEKRVAANTIVGGDIWDLLVLISRVRSLWGFIGYYNTVLSFSVSNDERVTSILVFTHPTRIFIADIFHGGKFFRTGRPTKRGQGLCPFRQSVTSSFQLVQYGLTNASIA